MRVVWRGTISFGLVTIPVRLYMATESKNVPSHQVHVSDGGRVQQAGLLDRRRRGAVRGDRAGLRVGNRRDSHAQRGRSRHAAGQDVALDRGDPFLPIPAVDPIYLDRSYYVEPEPQGARHTGCCATHCASRAGWPSRRSRSAIARSSQRCGCTMMCSSLPCSGRTRSASLISRSWPTTTNGRRRARARHGRGTDRFVVG